ncbi:MAG: ABC transporter ATP-binding protein [Bacteroidales bacterium]|nr:ABC transporter ATP-binding protein [Bacteroidales bacterium]
MNSSVVIKTEHLAKSYGDILAVKDLSLEVYRGEIFGFLGPNGAGKSTSIGMMCGLIKPDSGKVMINNHSGHSRDEIKGLIGLCPQEIILWPKLTCLEQLIYTGQMYGLSYRNARKKGKELLARMGLQGKRKKLAATLSGGMKRRLNLCLALVHDPEIIVLDEPEAGLDPQSRVMVRDFIRELGKQKTVILTTHNMDEADRLAERVAIIDHGSLLKLDTPSNLKKAMSEGEIMQVMITPAENKGYPEAEACLKTYYKQVFVQHDRILIREKADPETLWKTSNLLKENGFDIAEISIRPNTLEDVFISLTGRSLRD